VPIVTYGEDIEMAGRVGKSALTALGLTELIAPSMGDYFELSVKLGIDKKFYNKIRNKLIDTTTTGVISTTGVTTKATKLRNPFWDLRRYVRSLENGYEQIWRHFLQYGYKKPNHIYAQDPLNQPTNSKNSIISNVKENDDEDYDSNSNTNTKSSLSDNSKKSKSKSKLKKNKKSSSSKEKDEVNKKSKKSKKSKKDKKTKKSKK